MKKILLTNDDGVNAAGLKALYAGFKEVGEVYVVAPDRERSGSSHSLTVHRPLRVERLAPDIWAVSGTPADCVKIALEVCLREPPAIVISGINRGPNLGTDVLYSGTVSGAFEGAMAGIPSIAVSVAVEDKEEMRNLAYVVRFVRALAERVMQRGLPRETLLNLNFPNLPPEEIKGVKVTKLGCRRYEDAVHVREDPRGRTYYWIAGKVKDEDNDPGTDVAAVKAGMISVTPLHFDLTNYRLMAEIESWQLTKEVP